MQVCPTLPVADPMRPNVPVKGGGKNVLIAAMGYAALFNCLKKGGFCPMRTHNEHHK
nr:hypothetical protein [Yersinia intermedia]